MAAYTLDEILEKLRRMGKAKNQEEHEFQMDLTRQAASLRRAELKEKYPTKFMRDFDGEDGLLDFPLFQTEILVSVSDAESADISVEYIEKCAEYLINLPSNIVDKLCEASIKYCEDTRESVDFGAEEFPVPENIPKRKILDYIHPKTLIIDTPEDDSPVIHLELECDWEEEHNMEWIVKDNEVLYVGAFNDENPCSGKDYFQNASWNYAGFNSRKE